MVDIARVLMCSEADVRRGLDDSILPLYYDEVCRLMAEDGDGKRPSFTVANLRPAFEYMLVNQASLFALMVAFFEKVGDEGSSLTSLALVQGGQKLRDIFSTASVLKRGRQS
jgi:hypothetical protein